MGGCGEAATGEIEEEAEVADAELGEEWRPWGGEREDAEVKARGVKPVPESWSSEGRDVSICSHQHEQNFAWRLDGERERIHTHHLMHLPASNLRWHIRSILIVRTTRRLIRGNSRRFRINGCTAQPTRYPASVIHCPVFTLCCGAVYAKDLASAVKHYCYH